MEVSVIRSISDVKLSPINHGALYVAFMATLISILLTRFRNVILAHWRSPATSTEISSADIDDDFSDFDGDVDDNENEDVVSVSSTEDEDGEPGTRESDEEIKSKLHRDFSWSDFAKGKSVVKMWDGIGLAFDLKQSSGSLISIYDLDSERRIASVFDRCKFPSIARPPPSHSVVISPSRTSFKSLSIVAEWDEVGPRSRNRAPELLLGGVKKVCVGDSVSGVVTVADARKKAGPPLVTASEVQTWWDVE